MQIKWVKANQVSGLDYNREKYEAQLQEEEAVSFFTFPMYDKIPFIRHGFSTRLGGVSEGYLGTMNLSYSRGDKDCNVDENYRRICHALGIHTENLVLSDQVHDTIVYRAGKKDCQGTDLRKKKLKDIDGLVTNEKNVVLSTSYADCVPLFFVDERNKAIGLSHSGWRGTVGKIGAKTVERMKREFGTNPNDLKAMIGPSICQECYEVSQDVKEAFEDFVSIETIMRIQHKKWEEVELMLKSVFIEKTMKKYQLDLWMANKLILMEAGIPEAQIGVSCVCTCCNSELLYSHRASKGKRGNLSAFLEII